MMQYLIKRIDSDGDWFDLHRVLWPKYMRPITIASEPTEGEADYAIRVEGSLIEFNFEVFATHAIIEGEMTKDRARQVMAEILANIEQGTGQRGQIVEL